MVKYTDPNIAEKISRLKFSLESRNIEEFYQLLTSHPFFKNLVRLSDNSVLSNINIKESDPSKYMMKRDLEYYLPNDLMVKSDRSSMFYSLEVRSPFLDFDLAHKISRLHKSVIFKGNTKKSILKSILENYIPKKFIDNKKKGFQAPINSWLKLELSKLKNHYISKSKLDHNLFHNDQIFNNLNDFENGKQNHNDIWNLLIFQIWFDKYH